MDIFGLLCLLLAQSLSFAAQPSQQPAPALNRSELKSLMQSAHTAVQYEQLATYFEQRTTDLEGKIAQRQRELDILLASNFHPKFYAIQVDTSRNWVVCYQKEMSSSSQKAKEYRLAAVMLVPASTSQGTGQQ